MKKITSLLVLLCAFVGVAWAQTVVTTVDPGKKYVLQCKAADHKGYIADNGTVVKGKENNPSLFAFETTDVEGAYYLKSLESNKYLNTTDNKNIVASETPSTKWVLRTYAHTANVVSLNPVDVNNFLNNVQSHNDGTTSDLWLNPNHGEAGPGSTNACSLWTLLEWNLELPELTIDESSPVYYTIKNVRGSVYAAYFGAAQNIRLSANIGDESLFYFTAGADGTYVIHNKVTGKKLAAVNSWNDEGVNWFIKIAAVNQHYGYAIATDAALGTAWNNEEGANKSVATYSGNDIGSTWAFEKYEGTVPGIQLSTDETKVLYNIQNARRGRYANFVKHYSVFTQEGSPALGSYWYFVQDETAQQSAPEGVVACRVFNALHATGVEDHSTGHMGTDQWPAKVYYIKKHEKDYYGYVIYDPAKAEDYQGWNAYGTTSVCAYKYDDLGSIWNLIPTTKTIDQLKTEVTTQSDNWRNLISAYAEADYYSYPAEAVATAKTAIEGADVTGDLPKMYLGYLVQKEAFETLKATEKTAGPVAGQVIQLKNKSKNQYMTTMAEGDEVHRTSNANDLKTMWVVEEGTDGNVKLKNLVSGTYLGIIPQSNPVKMVAEADAAQFTFSNQVDMYGVFKPVDGGTYSFAHMDGWHDRVVGWEKVADASQWIISELSADEALDLMAEARMTAKASIGTAVGMYKETPNYLVSLAQVEDVLNNIGSGESVYDAETLLGILNWFNTTCADATEKVKMTPGYYYVKATGTGNRDTWYLSHKIQNSKECLWAIAPTGKLNADFIWKFETCVDGYKMQSVNLGQYFQLKTATDGGDNNTYIENDFDGGNKFLLTDNGAGKLSIKNSNSENIRTENGDETGAQVNYWSGESNESWYLIPATELEVDITAAGWATLHLPFDVQLSEDGLKAYAVSDVTMNGTEGFASLVDKTSIPANEGAVLEGAQGTYTLKIAQAEAWPVNKLEGTNVNAYIAGPAYVLGIPEGESEVMFAKAKLNKGETGAEGTTHFLNNANKAYLPVAGGASLVLRFNFGGETTAIESVLNNGVNVNAPIYDLSGRRVNNAVKGGIYIQNGKKFIVK